MNEPKNQTVTRRLTVAKISESELDELRTFLLNVGQKVKDNDYIDEDDEETNAEIGKLVRETFPHRPAFVAPLNLHLLLDNYQDKDSDILAHPKWINQMYELLGEIDQHLSSSPENYIGSGSNLHNKITKYLADEAGSKDNE